MTDAEPPLVLVHTIWLPLPWTSLPLSLNDRGGWQGRHGPIRTTLNEARAAIRAHDLPRVVGAEVVLHLWPTDRRRRDADNMGATLKVCQDALVAEDVLPDDSWVHVPFSGHRIHAPTKTPPHGARFVLEVRPCD
ncbi:hypothetical protein [Nocardioides nanhaiensis]|uniref:Uncharacterized protein n=1 Tax=Nocardioides nanhaiensis TaxID=1476871 RepID=A0ABP8W3G6_9ACTN